MVLRLLICQIQIKRHAALASSLFVFGSVMSLSNCSVLRSGEAASVEIVQMTLLVVVVDVVYNSLSVWCIVLCSKQQRGAASAHGGGSDGTCTFLPQ